MDLILWRHAEAQPLREGQDELARRLSAAGERQARRMANWLEQRLPASTLVLCSPAERCRATAKALERPLRVLPGLGPLAPPQQLLEAARWPDAAAPVLLLGHQPTLGRLAALLLAGVEQDWSLRKGSVCWLRSRRRQGQLQVVLQALIGPDLV